MIPPVTLPRKIPNFPEGYFDGIWIGLKKLVQCFMRTAHEQSFVLILDGVWALVLTDFRQCNIILDLVFRSAREITHSGKEGV